MILSQRRRVWPQNNNNNSYKHKTHCYHRLNDAIFLPVIFLILFFCFLTTHTLLAIFTHTHASMCCVCSNADIVAIIIFKQRHAFHSRHPAPIGNYIFAYPYLEYTQPTTNDIVEYNKGETIQLRTQRYYSNYNIFLLFLSLSLSLSMPSSSFCPLSNIL